LCSSEGPSVHQTDSNSLYLHARLAWSCTSSDKKLCLASPDWLPDIRIAGLYATQHLPKKKYLFKRHRYLPATNHHNEASEEEKWMGVLDMVAFRKRSLASSTVSEGTAKVVNHMSCGSVVSLNWSNSRGESHP